MLCLLFFLRLCLLYQDLFLILAVVENLVDVSGDSPDQLETSQERWQRLLNGLQLTEVDVLELTVEGVQELDEVLGLSVLLLERGVGLVVVVQVVAIWLLVVHLHHVDDLLHLRHVQLLVQGVERSRPLSPVLGFALGRLGLLGTLVFLMDGFLDRLSPCFLNKI